MAIRIYRQGKAAAVPGRHAATVSHDGTLSVMQRFALAPLDHARRLDRQADAELFAGHHAAAERLAHRAAEMRGWA